MRLVCPHRPPCPGCPRLGHGGVAPAALERVTALCEDHGLEPPEVVSGPPTGFRRRARLAIRGRAASVKIGLFEAGTHRVVDIPECRIHHPAINEVARDLEAAISETSTPPYADGPHRGLLRYAQIAVAADRRAQVTLVTNDTTPASAAPLLTRLRERLDSRLLGLWWNSQPERNNRVLGDRFELVAGEPALVELIGGARVHFLPGAFSQSHLDLSHDLVSRVHTWVPEEARVVELYAGAGAIGLGLVARGHTVLFNELSPSSLESLRLGVADLPGDAAERTRIVPGPASTAIRHIDRDDTVIVDPPRKGLERELRDALVATPPKRIVYVACGLPTFLEDTRALTGAMHLEEVVVYDLFPHTEHLEVAARFVRR